MVLMVIFLELAGCFFLYRGTVPMKADGEESTSKEEDLRAFLLSDSFFSDLCSNLFFRLCSRRISDKTVTMIPIAFDTIPGGGHLLLCLLMCSVYAANRVSPTHICLSLSCEHFSVPLSSLIRHTIRIIVCFLIAACLYYLVWSSLIV